MNPILFYNKYIIRSYFISNFNLLKLSQIPKLKKIKLKIFFINLNRINYVTSSLSFIILTKTKPIIIKGLKNYKENRTDIAGLSFIISKNKFFFLEELVSQYLLDNKDSLIRLKKQSTFLKYVSFYKYFDSLYVDKIYELNKLIRNTQQLKFLLFLETNKLVANNMHSTFLFNILINRSILPKPL
jgi:hypothetical protein